MKHKKQVRCNSVLSVQKYLQKNPLDHCSSYWNKRFFQQLLFDVSDRHCQIYKNIQHDSGKKTFTGVVSAENPFFEISRLAVEKSPFLELPPHPNL